MSHSETNARLPWVPSDISGGLVQFLLRLTAVCCTFIVAFGCGATGSQVAAAPSGNCDPLGETVPFGRVMSHTMAYTECPVATEAAFLAANACVAIKAVAGEECFMFVPPNTTFGAGLPSAAPRTVIVRTEAADHLYQAKQGTLYRLVGTTRISERTPAANAFVAASVEPVTAAPDPAPSTSGAGSTVVPAPATQPASTQADTARGSIPDPGTAPTGNPSNAGQP